MIRRTFYLLFTVSVLAQLTGCCWHRPVFTRGCYPYCNSFGGGGAPAISGASPIAAPVISGGMPISTGLPISGGIPGPDCVGCGNGGMGAIPYSSAPVLKTSPMAIGSGYTPQVASAPMPFNNNAMSYGSPPSNMPGSFPIAQFKPELMGLPTYPAGQPQSAIPFSAMPAGAVPMPTTPMNSTPLPQPMVTTDVKKN
jgi:hypothetical protein